MQALLEKEMSWKTARRVKSCCCNWLERARARDWKTKAIGNCNYHCSPRFAHSLAGQTRREIMRNEETLEGGENWHLSTRSFIVTVNRKVRNEKKRERGFKDQLVEPGDYKEPSLLPGYLEPEPYNVVVLWKDAPPRLWDANKRLCVGWDHSKDNLLEKRL